MQQQKGSDVDNYSMCHMVAHCSTSGINWWGVLLWDPKNTHQIVTSYKFLLLNKKTSYKYLGLPSMIGGS